MDFPAAVVDASAVLALVLSDEEGEAVEKLIQEIIENNGQVLVPALFWYEVDNGLLSALRRSRITEEDLALIESDLSMLPISSEQAPPVFIRQRIRVFAQRYKLTVYDASYLEIAARCRLRLKTLDSHLLSLRESFPFIL